MSFLTSDKRHEERRAKALAKLARGEKLGFGEPLLVQEELKALKAAEVLKAARDDPEEASAVTPPVMDNLKGRTSNLLAGALSAGEKVLTQLNGSSGGQTLVVTDQRAIIIKIGAMAGQTFGGKLTSFPFQHITSVEVRSSMLSGVFEISTPGTQGIEASHYGSGKGGAYEAPNAIAISKSQVPKFQHAANLIRDHTGQVAAAAPAPAMSGADEIRKLAELRDSGILTEAEFQAKKTDLLGRI